MKESIKKLCRYTYIFFITLLVMLHISPTSAATLYFPNQNFEAGNLSSWTTSGDTAASYVQSSAYSGNYNLAHWSTNDFDVTTSATIQGLESGIYKVSAWVQRSSNAEKCGLSVSQFGGLEQSVSSPVTSSWTEIQVGQIKVVSGELKIQFATTAPANEWCKFDAVNLHRLGKNFSFETGDLSGWQNLGDVTKGFAGTGGHYDDYKLSHWNRQAYQVTTQQTLEDLDDGNYTLRAFIQNSGGQVAASMFAENCGGADLTTQLPVTEGSTDYWTIVELTNITVVGGNCTIGFYSNATARDWIAVDNIEFLPTAMPGEAPTHMVVGGDITYRNLIYSVGGSWANDSGQPQEIAEILQDHAFNLARIRIYNEPGNTVTLDGIDYQVQPGYQDLADAIQNAQVARSHGMTLFISLHYSDFWTNPSLQTPPADWDGLSGGALENALYSYTYDVMTNLLANGVSPEYISIGNEINNAVAGVSRWDTPAQYFALLNKGYQAVKAVSPSTKVVIHLTNPDIAGYELWIDQATTYNLQYDILGASMYPFWTNWSIGTMQDFVSHVANYSAKNIMICEVGYPWTLETQWGENDIWTLIYSNNLDPDGPENYGPTPEGQQKYMKEYLRAMYNTGVVEGVSYWDPIAIDVTGAGWVVGQPSSVEDTSFFDYSSAHQALISLDAFFAY